MLDGWLVSLVTTLSDPEKLRRTKDTANRVMIMVKAALNHVVRDVVDGTRDNSACDMCAPAKLYQSLEGSDLPTRKFDG